MLACTALVGCSDDVIEGLDNQEMQGSNQPAYLTISFSANSGSSSRSTQSDANNNGDKDGTAEDSGHSNIGKEGENTISDALVVVVPENGNTALAKLCTIGTQESASTTPEIGIVNEFFAVTASTGTKIYSSAQPIKLSVGDYRVLVIANPPTVLKDKVVNETNSTLTDVTKVKELYKEILEGNFDATNMTKFTGTSEESVQNDLAGDKRFMMANKGVQEGDSYQASKLVKLTTNNIETNPAVADIEIERVVAKITFRPTTKNDITITNGAFTEKEALSTSNVYPVKVVFGDVKAKTIEATIDGNTVTLNCAQLKSEPKTPIYVLKEESTTKFYTESNGTYTEVKDITETKIRYIYDDTQAQKNVWYVKLEKYALVNLIKKTNYVRHTISATGLEIPFGVLNGYNFLWTPYWDAINEVTFEADGNFNGTPAVDTWFWNTLAGISTDSKKTYDKGKENGGYEYFKDIPTTNDNEGNDEVNGAGDKQHTEDSELAAIGHTLDYVFENATDIEHQTHGLSTGISFMARIYSDAECTKAITSLYRYDGHLFQTIQDMVNAYGENAPDAMKNCLTNETVDNLATAGIEKFDSNVCYYYTTEIKHYDNGNPRVMGNMEFAVMRNNIYSLSVTDIHVIGDPYVVSVPSTPDETDEAYLSVQAKIVPWIVRYHDIEFN